MIKIHPKVAKINYSLCVPKFARSGSVHACHPKTQLSWATLNKSGFSAGVRFGYFRVEIARVILCEARPTPRDVWIKLSGYSD